MRLLNGSDELRPSNNSWDWLGPGIYFWEDNPDRALTYAEEAAALSQKFRGSIKMPFVIGASIQLGNCLNLIEPNSIGMVKTSYELFSAIVKASGKSLPVNKGANRQLDCWVMRHLHEMYKHNGLPAYDTIRSPFHEGNPIYNGANFTERMHIEICVCNPTMIKSYFLPRPVNRFNPYI